MRKMVKSNKTLHLFSKMFAQLLQPQGLKVLCFAYYDLHPRNWWKTTSKRCDQSRRVQPSILTTVMTATHDEAAVKEQFRLNIMKTTELQLEQSYWPSQLGIGVREDSWFFLTTLGWVDFFVLRRRSVELERAFRLYKALPLVNIGHDC